jgi:hypothetical protein
MTTLGAVRGLVDSAIDPIRLIGANRILERQLDNLDTDPAFADIRALSESDLKDYVQSEWTRSKELDDKLAKLTAVLSVALTVGGTVAKIIVDGFGVSYLATLVVIVMLASMACFLAGALIGFRGIQPKSRYGYGAAYLVMVAKGGDEAQRAMIAAASAFQVSNAIRSNQASAAVDLVRNGIVLFGLAIAVSLFISDPKEVAHPTEASVSTSVAIPNEHNGGAPSPSLPPQTPTALEQPILPTIENSSESSAPQTSDDPTTPARNL